MPAERGKGRNQYNPLPPIEDIADAICLYWFQNKTDKAIWTALKEHHVDLSRYSLGFTKYKELRASLGLMGVRQQGFTVEEAKQWLANLRKLYPNAGRSEMASLFFQRHKKKIARPVVEAYFHLYESELLEARKRHKRKRTQFWSAGVNAVWCYDQHDKWKYQFGLCLHICVDPFSGLIIWLRIWWNNSNPILITTYYCDSIESMDVIPLLTQSDPGTENVAAANCHTLIRRWQDPSLPEGTTQHQYKHEKSNIKPEIEWSQLRKRFSPGFEAILDQGVRSGIYNMLDYVHVFVFRWVVIPWLQQELDCYKDRNNNKMKRKDKNKLTPHGRPMDIHFRPSEFSARDFGIKLNPTALKDARELFIPKDHPVLDLVPASFEAVIRTLYVAAGKPAVTPDTVWEVYAILVAAVKADRSAGVISADTIQEWIDVSKNSKPKKRKEEQLNAENRDEEDEEEDLEADVMFRMQSASINESDGEDEGVLQVPDGDIVYVEFSDDEDEANEWLGEPFIIY